MFLVRRVDQRRAKVLGTVSKRLTAGSGEEFLAAIGPAIEELFPERELRAHTQRGVPKEVALRFYQHPDSLSIYVVMKPQEDITLQIRREVAQMGLVIGASFQVRAEACVLDRRPD